MSDTTNSAIAKGVKLLLSNDENSTEELKAHLEEQIALLSSPEKASRDANLLRDPQHSSSLPLGDRNSTTSEPVESLPPTKKIKIECTEHENVSRDVSQQMNVYSGSSASEGLPFCMICKSSQTTWLNLLLVCLDCHIVCHQDCATPPAKDVLFNPEFVWHCDTCKNHSNTSNKSDNFCNAVCSYASGSLGNECSGSSLILSLPTTSDDLQCKIGSSVAVSSSAASSSSITYAMDSGSSSEKMSSASSVSNVSTINSVGCSENSTYTLVNDLGQVMAIRTFNKF